MLFMGKMEESNAKIAMGMIPARPRIINEVAYEEKEKTSHCNHV